ncbi:hypothetical protein MIMGU_mgv1a0262692mg, partial [Erythranthe guttata]
HPLKLTDRNVRNSNVGGWLSLRIPQGL